MMRPLRLDVERFGTFTSSTVIDFVGADFFCLVGSTGAGKSTVLDAICFALYGRAPRWGTGIEYALAPSATSGKVRLVFSAAGVTYVATRVVKRGAKGKVATASAALERLPSDIDPASLDDIGTVLGTGLASSAKAMSDKVEDIIGLPFDQFTKCVLLPQGAFAQFLHSSAAERRKILENLLGYSVYRDIQVAAGEEQRAAEAVLSHLDQQLAELAAVSDEALSQAAQRVTQLRELSTQIRGEVPQLDDVTRRGAEAEAALAAVDAESGLLTYIRRPEDASRVSAELAAAAQALAAARDTLATAEAAADKIGAEVSDTDAAEIERLLEAHAQAAKAADSISKGTGLTSQAEEAHTAAQEQRDRRSSELDNAEAALEKARNADSAATLRQRVHAGDNCPVCDQVVPQDLAAAPAAAVADAQHVRDVARKALSEADIRLADAQATAVKYRGVLDERLAQRDELTATLRDAPDAETLRQRRDAAAQRQSQWRAAQEETKAARQRLRRAEAAHTSAQEALTAQWQKFDHHRDRVATLSPPTVDRGDLAAAWEELCDWAAAELSERKIRRSRHDSTLTDLSDQARRIRQALAGRLAAAEVPVPRGDTGADFVEATTAALTQAEDTKRALDDKRARYITLADERAARAHDAQVAKQLHEHLGTRRFVNWLLSEALDELVMGASHILRRLTSGQYDLAYEDNDFYVIDHHDADLMRPAKTLSGGETFAAALSLALAMSEQLAGMSSRGACLEAILLDEGFGTLDSATLDQVAANLESLAGAKDRVVGVVTHVAALAERIPVRFEVSKDAKGSHVARVDS